MVNKYIRTIISATSKKEANAISDSLVKQRLVAGTRITKGPCRYWWDNEIVERE